MKEFVKRLIGRLEEEREISYADFYEYLMKYELYNDFDEDDDWFYKGLIRAISIVNQLAEEYNNGWIPCSERLPEKYGEYLCCDTYGNFVLGFPSESDTSDTGFIVETEHEYCYDIIAWMPLPEPYKKGEDK